MAPWQDFTADDEWHLRGQFRWWTRASQELADDYDPQATADESRRDALKGIAVAADSGQVATDSSRRARFQGRDDTKGIDR